MTESVALILPLAFGVAAILYVWLAVRVLRVAPQADSNSISYFLFLVAGGLIGSAFAYDTTDPYLYGAGRTLIFFCGGFLPVVFYLIYREYTVGLPHKALLALLCVVPAVTLLLAVTNPLHQLLWTVVESDHGARFVNPVQATWHKRAYGLFVYGLYGYSFVALASRLPTIARAHRRKLLLLLTGITLPYAATLASEFYPIATSGFPTMASSMVLMLPLYWWATVTLRMHEFSPLAYQTMFDHVSDPIIVLDRSQRIISANLAAQTLLDAREDDLIGQKLWQDLADVQALLDRSSGQDITQTVRLQTNRDFEVTGTPMIGPSGQDQGTVVVCRDVTERKEALRALADSEHLIRSLIEHSSNGILRFGRDRQDAERRFRCIFANGAAERFLGNGTLVGMPIEKIALLQPDRLLERFGNPTPARSGGVSYESAVETAEGEGWLRVIGEPVGKDFSVTLVDITQRKQKEDKILADALRDPLTGVLNRRGFEKEALVSIANSSMGAVLYLDLNQFKSINDRFGHQAGDALLKAFGHRLEFCLRPEDILARLGGDEFAIVLPGVSVDDAKHVAERLVETASEPYIIQSQEIGCSASVGIALMPEHGKELWHLVSIADQAMYNTKSISQADAANDRAGYVDAAVAS